MKETEIEEQTFAHPAAVTARQTSGELMSLVSSRRAMDAATLAEFQPFFWRAEISNGRLDSHFTRMAVSTLRNFAQDAESGVAFQNSHNRWELSMGRSLSGKFIGGQGDGVARVEADFYTIPGLQLGELLTDQLILGIRSGIVADVSVGFYGGKFVCSICGRDVFRDWDCSHMPGYVAEVEADGKTTQVIAEATVEDARLAEVSAVFKGSTPGASIIKAQMEAERGRISQAARSFFENRYRIHLPEKRVTVPGHNNNEEKTKK